MRLGSPPYLCRREDFAANLLHSRSPRGLSSGANVRIRIHTKFPWQKTVASDILFHNLTDAETLLLAIDLEDMSLGERLAALGGGKKARRGSLAEQAQEFRLFLKQSVFQETILLVDNLERKEDDRLLRFLLESGDISGLTVVLLGDSIAWECDLEFNEDPQNLLAGHLPASTGGRKPPELDADERKLLERIAAIGVPIPAAIARLLVPQGDDAAKLTPVPQGDARVASLLRKRCLMESRDRQGLVADPEGATLPPGRGRDADLAWLAGHSDWPYARIAHAVAGRRWTTLESDLKKWSRESPGQVAPGPAADLLCRHLSQLPPESKALEYAVDILIQGNCLVQAAQVLAGAAASAGPCLRLKKAHLAMRRKDYLQLGELLAGMARPPEECRDEWLYLNFIHCEKTLAKEQGRRLRPEDQVPVFPQPGARPA